jgi:GDP-L-fucose synthase
MTPDSKIYIAGHTGMVGSAIYRELQRRGLTNLVGRSSHELDLRRQDHVIDFLREEQPDYVFLAAAKVGGILANDTFRAEFLYDNLMIEANVIHGSFLAGVKKLLFLGSSCIYPKLAPQPLHEDALLTGPLETTNEPYAIAKIAGIKLCDAYRAQYGCSFISVMPTNLYGPHDNYDLETSHVIPALIRKFHVAKKTGADVVTLWGTGRPLREFMHVDDLAAACLFLMESYDEPGFINAGTGEECSIAQLADIVAGVVGYTGRIDYDATKPDGTPRKLMDSARLRGLGWTPQITLKDGLVSVYSSLKDQPWF